jgi:hydroxymethylbilane synthase
LNRSIIIGTRGSDLALWQANHVRSSLEARFPGRTFEIRTIKTTGDRILDTALSKIGDKGLFTKEIESALVSGEIDLAIHSLKDLPTTLPDGLCIGAVLPREKANDVLISKNAKTISDLPENARVATGSLRRRSQLLQMRPDVEVADIRGNVPTRINKFLSADLDAMILAYAGMHRLGLDEHIAQIIPESEMIPAVGQAAIAVEVRDDDAGALSVAHEINDRETEVCITAERAFLGALEGGCQVPIGAHAAIVDGAMRLDGFVGSLDGTRAIREAVSGVPENARSLGLGLAHTCLDRGAADILHTAREEGSR